MHYVLNFCPLKKQFDDEYKKIIQKINQIPLQLHDINSTRSVGATLASTVRGISLFFSTSSHKDLGHVHLVVLYLLLPIFVIDGKLS